MALQEGFSFKEEKMLHISKNSCVGCGSCIEKCPRDCIQMGESIACINQQKCTQCKICIDVCSQQAIMEILESMNIAIGTDDESMIKSDNHVGMSKYFQIWAYENGEAGLRETRENVKYKEDQSKKHGDPGKAQATASALKNVDVLIGERFGPNIARLKNKFVCAVVRGKRTIAQGIDLVKENINEIIEEKNNSDKRGIVLT
jgi:NAD-dependent dihydropyrimidine dehydrogenase PreA subunit/predicted Fe-Mo cluster-binding NifX family protein